jgi:uncharacterized protein (TIGR03083 family)
VTTDDAHPASAGALTGRSASELSDVIRSERLALLDLLETLTSAQWATPSLCTGWTVQDVAAHVAWAPVLRPAAAVAGIAKARFRLNAFSADIARRWATRGPEAILAQLRDNAANDVKPVGVPQVAALSDAVIHAVDIRRPLGERRAIPAAAFVPIADWHASLRWPLTVSVGGNVHRRIARLRLVATDVRWSYGRGDDVRGSAEALLVLLSGRPLQPDDLTGPGVSTLYARLPRGTGG